MGQSMVHCNSEKVKTLNIYMLKTQNRAYYECGDVTQDKSHFILVFQTNTLHCFSNL